MRPSVKLPFSLFTGFVFSFLVYQLLLEKKCGSGPALFSTYCPLLEIILVPSLAVVLAIIVYILIPKNDS